MKVSDKKLLQAWKNNWEGSLSLWSRFTKLKWPRWCFTKKEEKQEGLAESFAMIRLDDHCVVISLRMVRELRLEKLSKQILAHEIGHHVYTPADLADNARLIALTRQGLQDKDYLAGFISNLYTDLLINDRLHRSSGLDMAAIYKTLRIDAGEKLWTLYMRIYEVLWGLPRGELALGRKDKQIEADAILGASLIRVYAKEWLDGAGSFAALCLPYVLSNGAKKTRAKTVIFMDQENAGVSDEVPGGLAEIFGEEVLHPGLDPAVTGIDEDLLNSEDDKKKKTRQSRKHPPKGQSRETIGGEKNNYRSPEDYVALMESLGVKLNRNELAMRYYKERALPHLIPFPRRIDISAADPLPEGEDVWDVDAPVSEIDWVATLMKSPTVIPGITTMQRVYGTVEGGDPTEEPVNLYLGIDCSGSMPNPQAQLSYPVLAGAVMALSALRAGAAVMAVLSGAPGGHSSTKGFSRNEDEVLKILTGYLGTGYAFGIERLLDAFEDKSKVLKKTHIIIITDSDMFYMLDEVKKGWQIAKDSLETAGGGGTYVLHYVDKSVPGVKKMEKDGWDVFSLMDWPGLIEFARAFSRKKYGENK